VNFSNTLLSHYLILDRYANQKFPSLRNQLDENFIPRYHEFWESQKGGPLQGGFWSVLKKPVEPSPIRLNYDLEVCSALGVRVSEQDLISTYQAMVEEMVVTRRLASD
jgi:hypothetical protein